MTRRNFFLDLIGFTMALLKLGLFVYLAKLDPAAAILYYSVMGWILGWVAYMGFYMIAPESNSSAVRAVSSLICGIIWPIFPTITILHLLGIIKFRKVLEEPESDE